MKRSYNTLPEHHRPMRLWPLIVMMCLVVLGMFSAYSMTRDNHQHKQAIIEISGHTITVEIAGTDEERQRGLMERTHLPRNHGMLFIFPQEKPLSFWMRNTRIPLDILFFDAQGHLINIHHEAQPCPDEAPQCPGYPSSSPAKYVLELAGGEAKAKKIEPGAFISKMI